MQLKDLLYNREKLRKYDELKAWKENFADNKVLIPQSCDQERGDYAITLEPVPLPENIQQIILSALDAEIKKLDEE